MALNMETTRDVLSPLTIHLHGVFRVTSQADGDVTPRAEKAQALIALLATSPNGERSRQWLQAKLWSDRGPAQAAGSLRQALVQIRQAFGTSKDVLSSTRSRVSLDMTQVHIAPPTGQEFLEGMDVRDSEFESWLTLERSMREAPAPVRPAHLMPDQPLRETPRTWTVSVDAKSIGGDLAEWFSQLFADAVSRHMRDFFSARVVVGSSSDIVNPVLTVKVNAFSGGASSLGVRVSLEHLQTGEQLWAGSQHVTANGGPPIDDPDVLRLLNELVEAVGDTLVGNRLADLDDPDQMCRQAIRGLFSMRAEDVLAADHRFAEAFDRRERGLYLAWRAQIKTIQKVERHDSDAKRLREEAEYLCARALELEPNNSMVLATVANTRGFLMQDPHSSLALARRSVELNPGNPMAWWALSSANVYGGDIKSSYLIALNARKLAALSPNRFWWDNQLFGAAVVMGRLDEALKLAEAAYAQNPNFRPPLRYLIAFYANAAREEDALRAASALTGLEPDFTVERLVRDREYPASLIHRAPGLDIDKVSSII